MSKPSRLPNWATSVNFPHDGAPEQDTATKVEPLAGKKAIGWRPAELPRGTYMNDWMYLVYLWLAYLDAGAIDGDLEIDGNLDVEGTARVDGTLHVVGAATFDSTMVVGGSIAVAGSLYHGNRTVVQGLDVAISGSVSIGGTSIPVYTVAAGASVLVPFKAELISGISRVKSIAVIFANNTVPTLRLVTVVGPTTFVELLTGLGITASDAVFDGGHTKRTFTIDGGGTVIPAGQRQLFSLHNAAGSGLDVFNVEVVYDAPAP